MKVHYSRRQKGSGFPPFWLDVDSTKTRSNVKHCIKSHSVDLSSICLKTDLREEELLWFLYPAGTKWV